MGNARIVSGMNTKFTNDEYADIYFIYGFSCENAWAGVERKRRSFSFKRRHLSGVVFSIAHQQLKDEGILVRSTREHGVWQCNYE